MDWFVQNLGTFAVLFILLLLVFFAARSVYRTRKKGGCPGCSGDCGGCSHCHHKE